jgi:dCTP deaminase
MTLSDGQVRQLVESTSVASVAYQTCALIRELERINDEEFPQEAVRIRDVLICWPEFVLEELWKIHQASPHGADGPTAVRVRQLGRLLHELYSYIRYLTASSARQAPPAVQSALNQLTATYFPKSNGEPVCVIRPQWEYNLKYVPLGLRLKTIIAPAALDPDMALASAPGADLVGALWQWRRNRLPTKKQKDWPSAAPAQIAVLSFAGLDTHDSLLYPILAHELGHFIDFSHSPPLNRAPKLLSLAHISYSDVEAILQQKASHLMGRASEIWNEVVGGVAVCLRELLADLLALRMLGFGFFAAQSEFLKTVAAWPESLVTDSGYPGTKFRLWSITRHLLQDSFPGNIKKFLTSRPSHTLPTLNRYLDLWADRVKYGADLAAKPTVADPMKAPDAAAALRALQEAAVVNALDELVLVAEATIQNSLCSTLTDRFFDRVAALEHDLPPSMESESAYAFAEIMAAGWAYQLCMGEERELAHDTIGRQFEEYEKTCRLLMKAIELMPHAAVPKDKITIETASTESGAVLSKGHIAKRVRLPVTSEEHIGVVPLQLKAIEAASLDVRLGNWFVAMRRTKLRGVRLGDPSEEELLKRIGREETFVPDDKTFLIHPGDLVLGATLEFVSLPNDLMAFVEGKSRLGRLGLIVATASQVGPGFHGVVVLELANAGTVPLELSPGMPVAQLVFQKMTERLPNSASYRGRFYCQIKP